MKRGNSAFGLILAAVVLVSSACLAGCGDKEKQLAETTDKYTVCDFESNKELLSIAYYNVNGKVELSEQSEHVKSGKYCAKVTTEIGSSPFKGKDANFTFVTGTPFIEKTDYSDTVAFEMYLYNAYKDAVQIMLTADGDNVLYRGWAQPGENNFVMPVNRENIDLTSVSTIDFWFEGKPKNTQESYVFYMDRLVAVTADEAVRPPAIDYSGKTPFRFDREYEAYNLMQFMRTSAESGESRFANPRFSLNRDPRYILTGTGSLKAEFFSNEAGTGVVSVGFRTVRGMAEMSWNDFDYATTYLSCDVYNPTDRDITFGIALFSQINEVKRVDSLIRANSWSDPKSCRLLLQDMLDTVIGNELDIMTIVFYVSGMQKTGDALYIDNISFKSESEF